MMGKFVYAFEEGTKEMKSILGGKGANLAEMMKIGLPVPPGFTLTTEGCKAYYDNEKKMTEEMLVQLEENLQALQMKTNKVLGDKHNPLLVSVRSGAVISMPGMMDTVLNLGLNDETAEGLSQLTNELFAYESYKRFIQMFSDVVLGIEKYKFDQISARYREKTVDHFKAAIDAFKDLVRKEKHMEFPQDVHVQLQMAIEAVYDSWHNHRAIIYRKINEISDDLGTAVNVQSMVFGNFSEKSGTGVAFTRNPSTGEKKLYGEYLLNAQGEDVVAGIRTPESIDMLSQQLPEVYEEFYKVCELLEQHYQDMQDIEFTIEEGQLYLLQTRNGKRTAKAAIQVAVDLVHENVIDKETALMRIDPEQMDQLLHPTFSAEALSKGNILSKGLPASPGAASGKICFDAEKVVALAKNNEPAILVRTETSPEDIEGMIHAQGILTARGGMTSHAAVVARGMGKCCIAGCPEVQVESYLNQVIIGKAILKEGDFISLDGNTGDIYEGHIHAGDVQLFDAFEELMTWANEIKELGIRTNADNERDAKVAVSFGAEGIGLCRTEHMFFDKNRILNVRRLILSDQLKERQAALNDLLPEQKSDFISLFKVLESRPVTIRLLDPPLHEFLPHDIEEIKGLAEITHKTIEQVNQAIENAKEVNPMLGHRGCRLAITYPEIYEMQVKAIFEAACEVKRFGIDVHPEVMIPLVGFKSELKVLKDNLTQVAEEVLNRYQMDIHYKFGTMIEVPRAALTADEIAEEAEFFSFGTNDLTQMTLGFSRDDSGKFIQVYKDKKLFEKDPFASIDQNGVGKLMEMAKTLGRKTRPDLKIGICGEHGGEPKSIAFCQSIGLDYVSCSPYRVPIARIAAAQAVILQKS
ncbi:MAG: pyruvate, phosphate dikinase [Clostridia bacterium]|nr:pyruvate, phosphate dikinase [Clostridia bacterium]